HPLEQGPHLAGLQVIDDLPRGERLEIADFLGDGRRRGDQMKMVFENHVAVNGETAGFLEEAPGVVEELHGLGARKDGQPAYDCAGEEIGVLVFAEAVLRAGHGSSGTRSVRACVPTRSVGTRGNTVKRAKPPQSPGRKSGRGNRSVWPV